MTEDDRFDELMQEWGRAELRQLREAADLTLEDEASLRALAFDTKESPRLWFTPSEMRKVLTALEKERHARRLLQENFPKTVPAHMDRPR